MVLFGGASFALLAARRLKRRNLLSAKFPDQLLVLAGVTLLSAAAGDLLDAPTVGALPKGLPRFDPRPWRDLLTGNKKKKNAKQSKIRPSSPRSSSAPCSAAPPASAWSPLPSRWPSRPRSMPSTPRTFRKQCNNTKTRTTQTN